MFDAYFSATSKGHGLLLTGGDLALVQLQTQRQILLDGYGLDTLPYVINTSRLTDRLLREIYGIDLLIPPPDAGGGRVPNGTNRAVWEKYEPARWQEISEQYGVTEILTDAEWTLKLPVTVTSPRLRLYSIPERVH